MTKNINVLDLRPNNQISWKKINYYQIVIKTICNCQADNSEQFILNLSLIHIWQEMCCSFYTFRFISLLCHPVNVISSSLVCRFSSNSSPAFPVLWNTDCTFVKCGRITRFGYTLKFNYLEKSNYINYTVISVRSVSYTHLDVYKRQLYK